MTGFAVEAGTVQVEPVAQRLTPDKKKLSCPPWLLNPTTSADFIIQLYNY